MELFPRVKLKNSDVIRTSIDIRANSWVEPSILSELALWASPKYARHRQASAPCKLFHAALHLFTPKSSSPCFYLSCLRSLVMLLDSIHPPQTALLFELNHRKRSAGLRARAYSSVSQQPSTLLHYWPANGKDQWSLFAIIS